MKSNLITKRRALSAVAAVVGGALALSAVPAVAATPATPSTGAMPKPFHAPTSVSAADVLSVTGPANGTRTVLLDAHEKSVVTPGAVLVAGPGARTPHGLLVRVVSVKADAAGVEAVTVPASISDALAPGNYTKAITVPPPPTAVTAKPTLAPGRQRNSSELNTGPISWSVPISKSVQCNGTVTADINGSLTVSPSADVAVNVDIFGLHSASLTLSMAEDAALRASISAAASCTATLPVISNMALPGFFIGPVYIEPTFSVTLDALLNANASASISGGQHFRGSVGVGYDQNSGLYATKTATNTFNFDKPQLSGAATLEGGVTASMALMIEGLAGPRVDARGYLGINADSNAVPWWTLYGGINVTGGIQVLTFNIGGLTIWSQRWTLLQALGMVGATLPTAAPATTYSQTVHAIGGVGPYLYRVSSGSLPAGLTMDASGAITGVPTVPSTTQTSSFVVTATDSTGATTTAAFSISVPGLGIAGAMLPSATVGTPYSDTLLAIGAVGTPTWRLTSGTLPSGLTLASNGVISGTPADTATAGHFTVTLSDSTGRSVSKMLTLPISRDTVPVCSPKVCP